MLKSEEKQTMFHMWHHYNIIIYYKSSDVWNKVPFIVYAWEVTIIQSRVSPSFHYYFP